MNFLRIIVPIIAVLGITMTAFADPVTISTYDVQQTPRSGFGCWYHVYQGTITSSGRTVSGSVTCTPDANQIADYTGGSGTLNDNIISTGVNNNHLFVTRNADDGQPIAPVITLNLGGTYYISKILLYGGNIQSNALPGALTGAIVEIGGVPVSLLTTPVGMINAIGVPSDDILDLSTTSLATIATNQIILRNFTSSLFGSSFDQFSITEIEVDGTPADITISIDVRPNNYNNKIQIGSQQLVPIALLSDTTFDAPMMVNRTSLTFGQSGNEGSLALCQNSPLDVNRDGRVDLVCLFNAEKMGFRAGDTIGILKGNTLAGTPISGRDQVCVDRHCQ